MLKVLHPNRYFFWAVSFITIAFVFLLGQVSLYAAEMAQDEMLSSINCEHLPLGSLSWNNDVKGLTYLNDKYGVNAVHKHPFDEATYPSTWVSKSGSFYVYFANKSHQCVLAFSDVSPMASNFTLMGEKTVTTDRGDIKLNIFINNDARNEQKYLVQPADKVLQKIDGDYVFGLIRVDDPQLCAGTFGKILSTVKSTETTESK